MSSPKRLVVRAYPDKVPGNYRVSIKNTIKLLYWTPYGLTLTVKLGLRGIKEEFRGGPTSVIKALLTIVGVLAVSPIAMVVLLVTGVIEALKGRLMSVAIEHIGS